MPKQTYLSRYFLIINRIEKGRATFGEIDKYLRNESGLQEKDFIISKRTFQRDIKDIYEQFKIEIVNERKSEKRYFIKSKPETAELSQQLLQGYQMLGIINTAQDNADHIFLETRKPKGTEHFYGLLQAIKNKKVTNFNHFKYEDYMLKDATVHPMALKEARGRWYLLAVDTKDDILKPYCLDRMQNIAVSKKSFSKKYDYEFKKLFKDSFGIINYENQKPQKVVLSFAYEQGQYVHDYPLHHSQKLIKETNEEVIFELHIKITYDFELELLSHGGHLKVIEPATLRKAMQKHYKEALSRY